MDPLSQLREQFHVVLEKFCNHAYGEDSDLHRACTYALQGGGKRVRPLLVLLSNQACGGTPSEAWLPALAVELVHTYSLVHDDLPTLDNDVLRRGRATVHVQFSESTALLTGDALLSDSFSLFDPNVATHLGCTPILSPAQYLAMSLELARAIGGKGMVQGQFEDVEWTGRMEGTKEALLEIHRRKTGRLMAAACVMGGLSAGASAAQLETLRIFGENLGIWFQLQDDELDRAPDTGKTPNKDAAQGKLTLLRLGNQEQARAVMQHYESNLRAAGRKLDPKSETLIQLLHTLAHRSK
jgi:geranylgeranyl pyrophosphate synthase